jgi:exodeoxyribonuclease V gamma subunit
MIISPFLSFESLLQNLTDGLRKMPRGLTPYRVVVPSVHLRDWIQIQIAKRLGICMGFQFSTPQDFVLEVFRTAGIPRAEHWMKRHMEWAILEGASANASLLPAMPPGCSVRDRFAMARAVADRFDQYAHYRPEMIEGWASGKSYLPNHAEEAWQRGLWAMLHASAKNDDGLLPGRLKVSPDLAKAIPSALVIGSGSLDPLLVDVLLRLQPCGCEVDVRIVLPCLGFLEDLRKKTLQTPSRIPEEGDPESFEFHQDLENNPLLVSMGRQAAGAFVLLGKLDEQYSNWDEQFPGTPPATLLGHLQRGIQDNQGYENLDLPADSSLRIHACYGPRRELEVLRDELLRAFADIKDLKPEEVLIAVPSLEHYAPLVSAVFHTKENPLPVRLTELPASEGDEVLEGLLALLEMALGGRGRASQVLDLMQLRAVREALGVGDDEEKLEFLADKFRDSGITQGFAEGDEQPGGWKFSMNRLVAGEFFGPQEPESSDDQGFHLPVADSMGSNFSELGTFLQWLADIRSTLIDWQSATTPGQWANRLRQAAEVLLGGDDGSMDAADKCLRFLSELEAATPVDASVILDWMESETDEANRRAPITGATPFGRLKQLHNTPCRVLALVGMQNDNFPSRAVSPSWDLLRAKPKIWDRNARVDDRQMFLDAVLAPTERLIITASTQNIRTNKSQPFSTCVDELLAAAQKLGAERKGLILEHPLQPFSKAYFKSGTANKQPLGKAPARLAEKIHSAEKNKSPLWSGEIGAQPSNPDGISLAGLLAFWKDPAKAYLKAQGIAVPFDEDDDRDLDRSMLAANHLDSWKIKDAIMEALIEGDGNVELAKAVLASDRSLPVGQLGQKTWDSIHSIVEPIAGEILKVKGRLFDLEIHLEIDGVLHRVTGSVLRSVGEDALVTYRAGKISNAKYFLEPWIKANLAAAAGHALPTIIFDEDSYDASRRIDPIPPVDAQENLKKLLEGFLQGQCRPLGYAPITSDKLIASLESAASEWEREDKGHGAGEGHNESSRLAWRDRNPFEDIEDWVAWKDAVAQPLKTWGGFN